MFDGWSDVFQESDSALSDDFSAVEDFHWIRRPDEETRNVRSSSTKIFHFATKIRRRDEEMTEANWVIVIVILFRLRDKAAAFML